MSNYSSISQGGVPLPPAPRIEAIIGSRRWAIFSSDDAIAGIGAKKSFYKV